MVSEGNRGLDGGNDPSVLSAAAGHPELRYHLIREIFMPVSETKSEERKTEGKKTRKKACRQIQKVTVVENGMEDGTPTHHLITEFQLDDRYYTAHKEELEVRLQELNDLFARAGINLTADNSTTLKVDIHVEKYRAVTRRKAGRKKKKSNKLLEEILEYRKTHTVMETADWLGLTRQTYYKKLKAHQNAGDDGKVEF